MIESLFRVVRTSDSEVNLSKLKKSFVNVQLSKNRLTKLGSPSEALTMQQLRARQHNLSRAYVYTKAKRDLRYVRSPSVSPKESILDAV